MSEHKLPRQITAPSGIVYELAWAEELPAFEKKLEDEAKAEDPEATVPTECLQRMCADRGYILDDKASESIRTEWHPIYVQAVIKSDYSIVMAATRFRIRKLTNRECYRLMDVPEWGIDKLLTKQPVLNKKTGETEDKLIVSKSQHYKCAGNSIVCSCLKHIFELMFYPSEDVKLHWEQAKIDFEF